MQYDEQRSQSADFRSGADMYNRLSALALCLGCAATHAADNGFYLGLGAERSDFSVANALQSKDAGYKLIAGIRLLDSFGVEANFADHGKAKLPSGVACIALVGTNCPDTTNVRAQTTSAFAVGFLNFPLLDVFGKLGLSLTRAKVSTPGLPTFGVSDTATEIAWGAGAQAHFGSLAVRAEYEQFKFLANQKLNVISASFIYTIL
jgi:Outer membrane protein beta-barrel domain